MDSTTVAGAAPEWDLEEQICTGFTLAEAAFYSLGSPDGGGTVSIGGESVKEELRATRYAL